MIDVHSVNVFGNYSTCGSLICDDWAHLWSMQERLRGIGAAYLLFALPAGREFTLPHAWGKGCAGIGYWDILYLRILAVNCTRCHGIRCALSALHVCIGACQFGFALADVVMNRLILTFVSPARHFSRTRLF